MSACDSGDSKDSGTVYCRYRMNYVSFVDERTNSETYELGAFRDGLQ
jgi:hypothetical protein